MGVKASSHALNKLRWSADSRSLAAGDSNGCVTVLDIPAEQVKSREIDWEVFETVVDGFREMP